MALEKFYVWNKLALFLLQEKKNEDKRIDTIFLWEMGKYDI